MASLVEKLEKRAKELDQVVKQLTTARQYDFKMADDRELFEQAARHICNLEHFPLYFSAPPDFDFDFSNMKVGGYVEYKK